MATGWPSWNAMLLIRPATSGRSVTDSSERRLPTAVMVCGNDAIITGTASTVTLPGAGAPPLAAADADGAPGGAAPWAVEPARCVPNQ